MAFPRSVCAFLLLVAGALCAQDKPIGQLFSGDASVHGSVVLTEGGMSVMSGADVTAGTAPARLKLARGGELRICPGTRLSVASSKGGDLLLGMNTGALEADYKLTTLADSILTPDFRILLAGPGVFHAAFDANAKGDLCVRTLPGNNASLLISELAGVGNYQVRPGEQVLFHGGRVAGATTDDVTPCGCPAPPPAAIAALTPSQPAPLVADPNANLEKPLPPSQPGEVHVEVDTPFVFRAVEPTPAPAPTTAAAPPPIVEVPTRVLLSTVAVPASDDVLPPKKQEKKGFFHRLSAFLGGVFH